MILSRRSFLIGATAALAAPAIVRAELLMPVRKLITGSDVAIVMPGSLSQETYAEWRKIYIRVTAFLETPAGKRLCR